MLSHPYRYSNAPKIPDGFIWETKEYPSPQSINSLLAKCNLETHPPKRLSLALKKSDCYLSIVKESNGNLSGFVRVTSDKGLNANLWDLAAEPGEHQEELMNVLVNRVLQIIRQKMPGCSISIPAPSIALKALKSQGFLLDPGGIRTMGLTL